MSNPASNPASSSEAPHVNQSNVNRMFPTDKADKLENQVLAEFFLNDFDEHMRKSMGLTKEQARTHPQYQMMIAQRDTMKDELERRRIDGTRQLQPNLFPGSEPPDLGRGRGNAQGN